MTHVSCPVSSRIHSAELIIWLKRQSPRRASISIRALRPHSGSVLSQTSSPSQFAWLQSRRACICPWGVGKQSATPTPHLTPSTSICTRNELPILNLPAQLAESCGARRSPSAALKDIGSKPHSRARATPSDIEAAFRILDDRYFASTIDSILLRARATCCFGSLIFTFPLPG